MIAFIFVEQLTETEAERQWLEVVTQNFKRIAGEDGKISLDKFQKELNLTEVNF